MEPEYTLNDGKYNGSYTAHIAPNRAEKKRREMSEHSKRRDSCGRLPLVILNTVKNPVL